LIKKHKRNTKDACIMAIFEIGGATGASRGEDALFSAIRVFSSVLLNVWNRGQTDMESSGDVFGAAECRGDAEGTRRFKNAHATHF